MTSLTEQLTGPGSPYLKAIWQLSLNMEEVKGMQDSGFSDIDASNVAMSNRKESDDNDSFFDDFEDGDLRVEQIKELKIRDP